MCRFYYWVRRVVKSLRQAAQERGVSVGIMIDTQGPAIRTGDLPAVLHLQPGQKFTFAVAGEQCTETHCVTVNYDDLAKDINAGDVVVLDNGEIRMKVLSKAGNRIECEVLTEGKLGSRRHINLPGVKVNLPTLTEKDLADVQLGLEVGVDFISLSFVREAANIRQLRDILAKSVHKPRIVAKIEDQMAVKNLTEIILEADAVMVARGDLGIECPYEELPIIQRRVVKACLRIGRPVIVATHMLESMIENPMPTRAEITDVANAVFEQADGIMLSGETTVGKYPLHCVEVFDKIARRIERSGGANYQAQAELTSPRQKLVKSAVVMADELRAEAILVFTVRGNMARHTAWMRPRHSQIFAICEKWEVADSLAINWGVKSLVIPFNYENPEKTIDLAMKTLMTRGHLKRGQTTVVVSSISAGEKIIDAIQMRMVE
ncbi:MAG: pyruvate kinase [Verrucomicrobia bacterium]|nr:pyruvate kinase [Verrucomicrobiota bacterium]